MRSVVEAFSIPMLCVVVLLFSFTEGVQLRGLSDERGRSRSEVGFGPYDYLKHGEDWTKGMCFSRSRQSPIDFEVGVPSSTTSGVVSYRYNVITEPFELDNNGRVFFADVSSKGLGGLTHEDVWYDLLTISFHTLSEHTFNGQRLPMEVHLTHKRYDNDALVMVAIPISSSNPPEAPVEPEPVNDTAFLQQFNFTNITNLTNASSANASVSNLTVLGDVPVTGEVQPFLWQDLPLPHSAELVRTREDRPLDLNKMMQSGQFYEYAGSMTGPPCAEQVTWLVRTKPLMVVASQIKLFMDAIYDMNGGVGNYRAVMPLNGRIIRLFSSMQEAPVRPADFEIMTAEQREKLRPTPEPLTAEEQRMHDVSADTMQYVNNASDNIKAIEERIFWATSTTAPPTPPPLQATDEEIQRIKQAVKVAAQQAVAEATQEISTAIKAAAQSSVDASIWPVKTAAAVQKQLT